MHFAQYIATLRPQLSPEWAARYGAILHPEHLNRIAQQIALYQQSRWEAPKLAGIEALPISAAERLGIFVEMLNAAPSVQRLEAIPFRYWLLALGQQITATSLVDERAIPPLSAALFQSCQKPHNSEISVALRAWEKHIGRSEDAFWGQIKGNPAQKEILVQERIAYIIEHPAWWNVFEHPKHGAVYELREPLGHGIRWAMEGLVFIGFLEPLG